ncbi:hypothetical protein V1519DRAFT_469055 [Lipomyces tetrasporus]
MVLEVGVSETMGKLERDARMWLLGLRNEVRVCIGICLDETLKYHMPPPGIVGPYTGIDEEVAAATAAMFQNRMDAVNLGSPLIYRDHNWVNSLTGRVSVYRATPDFSDIVCVSATELSLMHVEDREVRFNFVKLHDRIRDAVADTGRLRYVDYLNATVGHHVA